MHDRRSRSELEGLQLLGDLADDMVVSLGRVMRVEPLAAGDRGVLTRARDLFGLMTSHDAIYVGTSVGAMLGDERSYLDALRVVERQAEGASIEDFAAQVVNTLTTVLNEPVDDEARELEPELERLRQFFVGMGENSLDRADELSRPRQESQWRSTQQPSSTS